MTTTPILRQLTLQLFARQSSDFDDYYAGPNVQAVAALRRWSRGEGPWYLYLWGRAGVGKSHLLQAAMKNISAAGAAMYIPTAEILDYGVAVLDGLDEAAALCIDDAHALRAQPVWQTALFGLFNELQARGTRLLVSAVCSPRALGLELGDLASRLSAGLIYQLRDLSDEDKRAALNGLAVRRGIELPGPVAEFIMRRCTRDMGELSRVFAELDEASLSAGRPLTVPFVREILGLR